MPGGCLGRHRHPSLSNANRLQAVTLDRGVLHRHRVGVITALVWCQRRKVSPLLSPSVHSPNRSLNAAPGIWVAGLLWGGLNGETKGRSQAWTDQHWHRQAIRPPRREGQFKESDDVGRSVKRTVRRRQSGRWRADRATGATDRAWRLRFLTLSVIRPRLRRVSPSGGMWWQWRRIIGNANTSQSRRRRSDASRRVWLSLRQPFLGLSVDPGYDLPRREVYLDAGFTNLAESTVGLSSTFSTYVVMLSAGLTPTTRTMYGTFTPPTSR